MSFDHLTLIDGRGPRRLLEPFFLLVLTVGGFGVMGYHPGLEDDGIYLSAVHSQLNPSLYPHDAGFIRLQVQATLFDEFIAGFVRVTHIPVAWGELLWQFVSLYAIVWAGRGIARRLFPERNAQWGGVAMLAAMFTLPVAGTALNLADQHLHPRTMTAALILWAVCRVLARKFWPAAMLLVFAMLLHPIMATFGMSFCIFLALVMTDSIHTRLMSFMWAPMVRAALPLGWVFEAPSSAWQQALGTRTYYFLYRWRWYEWLGAIGPLVLFGVLWRRATRIEGRFPGANDPRDCAPDAALLQSCSVTEPDPPQVVSQSRASFVVTKPGTERAFSQVAESNLITEPAPETVPPGEFLPQHEIEPGQNLLARFSLALLLYGAFHQGLAMVLLGPSSLIRVTPLQPMRYLHLVYVFLVLVGGSLLGKHVLKRRIWLWTPVLVLAGGGMFLSQRLMFRSSEHLELPGHVSTNSWLQAFAWIRQNTPENAYFAIGPDYLAEPGEDYHSFRALAERSLLADAIKDAAVVTQVPELAPRWKEEVDAQSGWRRFGIADFELLKDRFGVDWVLVSYPPPARLICEWHNDWLSVCQIPGTAGDVFP